MNLPIVLKFNGAFFRSFQCFRIIPPLTKKLSVNYFSRKVVSVPTRVRIFLAFRSQNLVLSISSQLPFCIDKNSRDYDIKSINSSILPCRLVPELIPAKIKLRLLARNLLLFMAVFFYPCIKIVNKNYPFKNGKGQRRSS